MKWGFVKAVNKKTGIISLEGIDGLSVVEVPYIADPKNMPAALVPGQRVKYEEATRAVNVQPDFENLSTRIK